MKPRYFKQGALVWRFTDTTAEVRITNSIDGWRDSIMNIDDMKDPHVTEITAEEGEPNE